MTKLLANVVSLVSLVQGFFEDSCEVAMSWLRGDDIAC